MILCSAYMLDHCKSLNREAREVTTESDNTIAEAQQLDAYLASVFVNQGDHWRYEAVGLDTPTSDMVLSGMCHIYPGYLQAQV